MKIDMALAGGGLSVERGDALVDAAIAGWEWRPGYDRDPKEILRELLCVEDVVETADGLGFAPWGEPGDSAIEVDMDEMFDWLGWLAPVVEGRLRFETIDETPEDGDTGAVTVVFADGRMTFKADRTFEKLTEDPEEAYLAWCDSLVDAWRDEHLFDAA